MDLPKAFTPSRVFLLEARQHNCSQIASLPLWCCGALHSSLPTGGNVATPYTSLGKINTDLVSYCQRQFICLCLQRISKALLSDGVSTCLIILSFLHHRHQVGGTTISTEIVFTIFSTLYLSISCKLKSECFCTSFFFLGVVIFISVLCDHNPDLERLQRTVAHPQFMPC